MKRRHVVSAALWALMALLAGVALMPRQMEIGLMLLRDRNFDGAAALYLSRWQQGDRTWSVATGLASALEGTGDPTAAAEVLAEFVRMNPEQLAARRQLANAWKAAGESKRYREELNALLKLQRDAATLRELAGACNVAGDQECQFRCLDQLAGAGQASDAEVLQLARWQAANGLFQPATATLRRLPRSRMTPETMELLTRLHIETGGSRALEADLLPWLKARRDLALVARFGHILSVRGHLNAARRVVDSFEGEVGNNPDLLLVWVEICRAAGDNGKALKQLRAIEAQKQLPHQAWPTLVDLALEAGRIDVARAAIFGAPPDSLPEWALAYFVDKALAAGDKGSLYKLRESFGDHFLHTKPLLASTWALAEGNKARALQWAERAAKQPAAKQPMDARDAITLAALFAKLGKSSRALRVLEQVPNKELPEPVQVQLAWLYVDLDEAARGRQRFGNGERGPAWAILAAATGSGGEVADWVAGSAPGPRLLLDLYYLCAERSDPRSQWALAKEVKKRGLAEAGEIYSAALIRAASDGVPVREELEAFARSRLNDSRAALEEREAIVRALLRQKSFGLALPLMKQWAKERRETWFFAYIEAAAASDRSGLVSFLEHELGRKDLPAGETDQVLYALVEHGGPERALPHVKKLAEQRKGDWAGVYEWVLTLLKKDRELMAWWKARAADPGLTEEQQRELAYRMLAAGEIQVAEPLFRGLASTAGANSKEVRQLRYLWGPRPNAMALGWLEQRARNASGREAEEWVTVLLESGDPARALNVMAGWRNPRPAIYLRALQAAGRVNLLERELEQRLITERDPEEARRLARLALEQSLPVIADIGFRTILAKLPNDREALAWHGRIAFAALSYNRAREALAGAINAGENDPEVLLLFGECVERDEGSARALLWYQRGLAALERQKPPARTYALLKAHLLSRVGRWDEGRRLWEQLLAADPADRQVRADYAALLIHRGLLVEAKRLLDADPRSAPARTDSVQARVELASPSVQQAYRTEREFAIRIAGKLPEGVAESLERQLNGWVEGVSGGYDSLLIRTVRPVDFAIHSAGARLEVTLKAKPQKPNPSEEKVLARRLEVLRAQLELAHGELARSGRRYEQLLLESRRLERGNDSNLLLGMAMVEGQMGRWKTADALYGSVLSHDPAHAEAARLQRDLWREQRDQVKLETKQRSVGNLWQDTITQLAGHQLLSPSIRAGYLAEWNRSSISGYRTGQGVRTGFYELRSRFEGYLQHDSAAGGRVKGQLFWGAAPGAGGEYFRSDNHGGTRLSGEVRRPYWEFMEAVAQYGTRSRFAAERMQRIGPLSAWITAAANRYGLAGLPRAADTAGVSAGAAYPITRSRNPFFADYSFDMERARFVAGVRDHNQQTYRPLPFADREVHSAGLRNARRIGRDWRAEGAAGMAVDRLGGRGPYVAGRIGYESRTGLAVDAWFDRRLSRFDTSTRPTVQFGISVTWRYGVPSRPPASTAAKAQQP
ncbi:MAG: hypothetical protein IT168_12275 [Bryobacterales bacterium]|nr:hypothetical protein [Bryobacterales bacterium]